MAFTISVSNCWPRRRNLAYHDCEGAIGNINTTEAHIDHIGAWLGSSVENVISPIFIFDDISLSLSAIWGQNRAGHFPLPSSLGIHYEAYLLTSFHNGGNTRTCRKGQKKIKSSAVNPGLRSGHMTSELVMLCCAVYVYVYVKPSLAARQKSIPKIIGKGTAQRNIWSNMSLAL